MKKVIFLTIFIIFALAFSINSVLADSQSDHQNEINVGKALVETKVDCNKLTDEQFEAIGEYLMEQMHPGESHEAMHQMMGMKEGTKYHKNLHINMAKKMYCNQNSMMDSGELMGTMPMMNMIGNMMNWSNWGFGMGWSWFGRIFMLSFWLIIIFSIIALIRWLINQSKPEMKEKSALDFLKERYAKGEIDEKEFEEKKKNLS